MLYNVILCKHLQSKLPPIHATAKPSDTEKKGLTSVSPFRLMHFFMSHQFILIHLQRTSIIASFKNYNRPRGIGWRGRWEGGSGWGIYVNPWLIHVNVWQKPLQYCKIISLQLIKINGKKITIILRHVSAFVNTCSGMLLPLLSHFSRVWLCVILDGSPPGSAVPGILQARTLEWDAISFNAWKWKVKVKLLSRVRLFMTPWTAAHQAPPSMGFFQVRVLEWGAIAFSMLRHGGVFNMNGQIFLRNSL